MWIKKKKRLKILKHYFKEENNITVQEKKIHMYGKKKLIHN